MTIAKLRSFELPCFTVASALAGQCMSNLVEQNLLYRIQIRNRDKVLTQGDALLGVVAKSRSANRSVKTKRVVDQAVLLKKSVCETNYFLGHLQRLAQSGIF